MTTARLVGLAADGKSPLSFPGRPGVARFRADTKLPVGSHALTFGQIVFLAGDFYAHLDDRAATDFAAAWPETRGFLGWLTKDYRQPALADDAVASVAALIEIIERDKDAQRGAAGEFARSAVDAYKNDYPARRYLALASQNFCHFGSQHEGRVDDDSNEALRLYRRYHARALEEAAASARSPAGAELGLLRALAVDAFGNHFLTDLFAAGHIRVPRRILGERYGVVMGALYMSHKMHAEDNARGLWCRHRIAQPGRRIVWRAYGDGLLRSEAAETHRAQVEEAVRRSAAEVFAAYCGVSVNPADTAEALLPQPLPPGTGPGPTDVVPAQIAAVDRSPNHFPLYRLEQGRVMRRLGDPERDEYGPVDVQPQTTLYVRP